MWQTLVTNTTWIRFFLCEEHCHTWIHMDQISKIKEEKNNDSKS